MVIFIAILFAVFLFLNALLLSPKYIEAYTTLKTAKEERRQRKIEDIEKRKQEKLIQRDINRSVAPRRMNLNNSENREEKVFHVIGIVVKAIVVLLVGCILACIFITPLHDSVFEDIVIEFICVFLLWCFIAHTYDDSYPSFLVIIECFICILLFTYCVIYKYHWFTKIIAIGGIIFAAYPIAARIINFFDISDSKSKKITYYCKRIIACVIIIALSTVIVAIVNKDEVSLFDSPSVYWVTNGEVWHETQDCPTLANSYNIHSGTISQSHKSRACKVCY